MGQYLDSDLKEEWEQAMRKPEGRVLQAEGTHAEKG